MAAAAAAPGRGISRGRGRGRGGGGGGRGGSERRKGPVLQDLDIAELESIVFGTRRRPAELKEEAEAEASKEGAPKKRRRQRGATGDGEGGEAPAAGKPAWTDPDDADLLVDLSLRSRTRKLRRSDGEGAVNGREYERRLREQFAKLHGPVQWAQRRDDEEGGEASEVEEDIPTSAKLVAARRGGALPPQEVDIIRLKELPLATDGRKGPTVIRALQFHPGSKLLLSAGFDKRLRLFSVDGVENEQVSSHFFKQFPIQEACFTPNGDQILLLGTFFKMWGLDVRTGVPTAIRPLTSEGGAQKFSGLAVGPDPAEAPGSRSSQLFSVITGGGGVVLCDAATKYPVRTFRMSTAGVAATFAPHRDTLFTADEESNVYEWDLGSGRCLQRAKNAWATKVTRLAISRTDVRSPKPLLAMGTATGNVDFFDISGPKLPAEPFHSMDNLTTSISSLRFHHSGELLAAASQAKKDALKLLHLGTMTVFQNWPTFNTPLHRVSAVDLSRRGGLLAVGNEKGRVLLYQLQHYASAAT